MRNECSDPKFTEISRFRPKFCCFRPQNHQISTPKPSLFWPKFRANFDTFFVKFHTFFVKFCTFLTLFYPPKKHVRNRVHENPKMNFNIRPFSCQKKFPQLAPDPLIFVKKCDFFVCAPETHKFHTFFALFSTFFHVFSSKFDHFPALLHYEPCFQLFALFSHFFDEKTWKKHEKTVKKVQKNVEIWRKRGFSEKVTFSTLSEHKIFVKSHFFHVFSRKVGFLSFSLRILKFIFDLKNKSGFLKICRPRVIIYIRCMWLESLATRNSRSRRVYESRKDEKQT